MVLASSRVGALAGRFGPRAFMTLGPLCMAAGTLWLLTVATGFSYVTQVLPAVIVLGLGLTITVSPLTSTVLDAVAPGEAGIASAVNNTISRVAGLFSVAAVGALVGESLDLTGFHRAVLASAVLFVAAALAAWFGVRNPATDPRDPPPEQ